MKIDAKWVGEMPRGPEANAVRLVAILVMSNEAEAARDPFERRLRLNEMQAAIQTAKPFIEALAEGMMFAKDDDAEDGTGA